MTAPNLAAAARWYAREGFPVLPVRPRDKVPDTARGLHDATTDPATLARLWQENPDRNVGIRTGQGVFVLDVDGADGEASLQALEVRCGPLPETVESTTGRGRHLYFRHPAEVTVKNSAAQLGPGLDVRGDGGYIVAPPSFHPNGNRYGWRDGHRIDRRPIADAPPWLLDLVQRRVSPPPEPSGPAAPDRVTAYAQKALGEELSAVASAPEGQRNDCLNRAAFSLGQLVATGALDRRTVERALIGAAQAAGLDRTETERTIRSGIEAGTKDPRHLLPSAMSESGASGAGNYTAGPVPEWHEVSWPEPLKAEAFHGLAGEVVRQIEPHSEADPAALLFQFLAAFGNAIGRGPHLLIEGDTHATNIFVALVGRTAKSRKGTSWGRVRELMRLIDENWTAERIMAGLSSGEGLIWQVRDPIEKQLHDKKTKRPETVIEDEGIADKRLLIVESELASTLRVMGRIGNTLSPVVREAWDRGDLRALTKNSPARATAALISMIGHVTTDELRRYLDRTEVGNGFANRFLFVCARRSKALPEGGGPVAWGELPARLWGVLAQARGMGRLGMTDAARQVWREVYPELSEGKAGLLGAVIARAEAQVMRLALLYALLDGCAHIDTPHLLAALAAWDYCEVSARFVFGSLLGDPVADAINRNLRQVPPGLSRTEISAALGHHVGAGEIARALASLAGQGLALRGVVETRGRTAEVWRATA